MSNNRPGEFLDDFAASLNSLGPRLRIRTRKRKPDAFSSETTTGLLHLAAMAFEVKDPDLMNFTKKALLFLDFDPSSDPRLLPELA